jgi:1-acyl-sn-glycerol-3-phosphate acyltransferase
VLVLRLRGRGLPISSLPPPQLVRSGPYGVWRHPIYVGFALAAAGLGLLAGSVATAAIVVPVATALWFATWVRLYEEPGLQRRFGEAFRVHAQRTPLLLPRAVTVGLRRLLVWLLCRVLRVRVEGREHVPARRPLVFASDHLCYLDLMFAQLPCRCEVAIPVTAEVFRPPLSRLFIALMGGFPKRRYCHDPGASLAVSDVVAGGGVLGIAVEGERHWTGGLERMDDGVARKLLELGQPVFPVAFVGSYRLWPRWSGDLDRRQPVVVRIGPAVDIAACAARARDGGAARAVAEAVREAIAALRDPDEAHVDLTRFRRARPELALWRCPVCRVDDRLRFDERRWLTCASCGARWDAQGGDLTLVEPAPRAGEKRTLGEWCALAGDRFVLDDSAGPLLRSAAEWREDPAASLTLLPLHALGPGEATLWRDRVEWTGAGGARRRVDVARLRTVTTERNDTVQLGDGRGVVQLVLERASPRMWQAAVGQLLEAGHER